MSLTKDIADTSANRKRTKERSPPLNHFSHDRSPMQFYSTHSSDPSTDLPVNQAKLLTLISAFMICFLLLTYLCLIH